MFSHLRRLWKIYVLGFLVLTLVAVSYVAYSLRPHSLRFVMLDIGQGDALYIEAPDGNQVIVDGGPGDALLVQVGRVMPAFDHSIDLIVNTNPDKDHFEGFIPLLDRYSVGAFMEAGTNADTNPQWIELKKKVAEKHIPDIVAHKGQHIDLGKGVAIDIIFPDRDLSGLAHNDGSIVARLTYGKTSVMLTGDSTQRVEKYLISPDSGIDPAELCADILKVGHHGSKTSTSPEFVKAVHPSVALISAGKNNIYGLPHQITLDTLASASVPYLITFNEGAIEYDSDGVSFWRVK